MHELALCRSIRDVVEAHARKHGINAISRVRIEVGVFSCVSKEALDFAFDVVMRGSVAQGAKLVIQDLPGSAHCQDCGTDVILKDRLGPCPACGGSRLLPTGGDDLRIKDMEVA